MTDSAEPRGALTLGAALGAGAVAQVVLVTDEDGREFAGKILHASHAGDPSAHARFSQEAALAQSIVHPNVVRTYGWREADGRPILLMERVRGPDLASWLSQAPELDQATVVGLLLGIAAGLGAAHAAGVVHRDLKPSNVMLDGPELVPKIADFGMARANSLSGVDADALTVVGTPDYMAPESLDPLAVDGRTDLYALGCIAFEMLVGTPPFHAATPFGILQAHRDFPLPELSAPFPLSEPLRTLVVALLAKSPADRPAAAETVCARLQQLQAGETTALVAPTATRGLCNECRAPLLDGLAVCLSCGTSVAVVHNGDHTVLVTGPGEVGDKLDSAIRDRLLTWLGESPQLGLAASDDLKKRIPRLPFVLASGVSEPSAQALIAALQTQGVQADAVLGGAMKSPDFRSKARSIAGRTTAVVGASVVSMTGTLMQHAWFLGLVLIGGLAAIAWTMRRAMSHASVRAGSAARAFPAPMQAALGRVETAVVGIEHARHRDALRAVVGRTLALAPAMGETADDTDADGIGVELAAALDAATAATGRLDALDRKLTDRGATDSSDETRALLHERDTWSTSLLRLIATLDGFAERAATARNQQRNAQDDDALAELRAQVEALEEVQGR